MCRVTERALETNTNESATGLEIRGDIVPHTLEHLVGPGMVEEPVGHDDVILLLPPFQILSQNVH